MLLIFDLDDTLVYTHKKAYEKTKIIASIFNKTLTFEDFKRNYGKKNFTSCVKDWFGDLDPIKFRNCYNLIRKEYPYEPIGDVIGLLEKLLQKHKIGILTNSTFEGTDYKLNCLGLTKDKRDMFQFIYHQKNLIAPKPNPHQIYKINQDGFSLDEMIYIGDNVRDYKFSLNGGISFYGVLTGLETESDFLNNGVPKSRILKNIHDLLNSY
jgi:phosphoglycolate phosphatase-like HAD superfamily hydrolase